jgi:hypothetical protein
MECKSLFIVKLKCQVCGIEERKGPETSLNSNCRKSRVLMTVGESTGRSE